MYYVFGKNSGLDRFSSYHYQLREIFEAKPKSVLEIGVGDKVIGSYLKNNTDITYTSADYSDKLGPDIVADVRHLPCADNSFDVVCAFEVLEHIPFQDFELAVKELLRVSKHRVLISMPHLHSVSKFLSLELKNSISNCRICCLKLNTCLMVNIIGK